MQKEMIAKIARTAAIEALGYKNDIINEEFDARYHDVKLLMKNYRKLKAHYAMCRRKHLRSTPSVPCVGRRD